MGEGITEWYYIKSLQDVFKGLNFEPGYPKQTNRTTKQAIISSYLTDKEYGRKENTQKKMYEQLQKMTFEDIKAFSEQNLKGQKESVCNTWKQRPNQF